ncbi:sodium-dependent transporter [Oceanirhabdus sp. W0125-5]|uniref:sodium-dependent transporter n=1 Tax=Oceanirhabdus sp. W0125-5 TaxID=2999116 RepID=UPI0022F2BA3B|nr:sodium-dependent transporter [Oceanirhabdus sp. W0125-5]WBW94737.1 sodium-dependent transporter [Oceanirhabdus sp. W0125-5]
MKRDNFGSKLGLLAAAAGSAIGLGNIWKFPYVVGENGGAAFILVYLLCIALIGFPLMMTEFAIGRFGQANVVDSFKKIKPNTPWFITGILSALTPFLILSFYIMIAGWVFTYIGKYATGAISTVAPADLANYFTSTAGNATGAILSSLIVITVTAFIVIAGIKEGVEKYSKILMPLLLVLLIVLMFRSLTLDGASTGVNFLFKPDFSKLTPESFLEALGHAFYSLSLAMGIIITYGSYVKKDQDLTSLSLQVTIADTVIALLAGLVIFPAVFAYGFQPDAGPSLIFITLPAVFESMPLGSLFGLLFFSLIGIAAITSTISLLEVVVSFVNERFNISRNIATFTSASVIFLLSIPSILSFSTLSEFKILGMTFFDLFDFITAKITLPLTGLLICIFAGWVWGAKNVLKEVYGDKEISPILFYLYSIIIKIIAPLSIIAIFLHSLNII